MPRSFRPRPRRVIAPTIVVVLVAGVVAVFRLNEQPPWLAWCPPWLSAVLVAGVLTPVAVAVDRWNTRRHVEADREQEAVDRLLRHVGRRGRLPRLGDRGARPLALRVHESIPLDQSRAGVVAPQRSGWLRWRSGVPRDAGVSLDPDLPLFVERDVSEQIRDWVNTARVNGGFLVLVGNSSVGKTRLLYETVREMLPDFAILAPDPGDGGLVNDVATGHYHLPKMIVWLDELQRFLPGPYFVPDDQATNAPLKAAAVRRLLAADEPVVILGTLWPEYASQLRATDRDPATGAERPRYPHAMDILNTVVRDITLRGFSDSERATATMLASSDSRLAAAVGDRDYNVTEVLAGARQMVRRYEQATEAQRAVLHAAIDARRVGIQAVLSEELLRTAARGYLSTVHPDDSWFPAALAELTSNERPQDKATAPLISVLNADRTAAKGYVPADYLLQRLVRQRRRERLPEATWHAFALHTHNRGDLSRLAESTYHRMLYGLAEPLYRRLDETPGSGGVWFFTDVLTLLLARQGRIDELRTRADAGNSYASTLYVEFLVENGRLDELRDRATAGDDHAANRLPHVLAEHGQVDEAIRLLRARVDAGDPGAMYQLANLLAQHNQVDEATVLLRATPDIPGDDEDTVQTRLAELLAAENRLDELRALADSGSWPAAYRLADLLATQCLVDELRGRAGAGDQPATHRYAELLIAQDRAAEALAFLRDGAEAGNQAATARYAELLAKEGRAEEAIEYLRARGNNATRRLLADLLAKQGHLDQALAVLPARPAIDATDPFDPPWPSELTEFQARHGLIDELRADADKGDDLAAELLAETLAEQGDIDGLRGEVDAGTPHAAAQLVNLLRQQGQAWKAQRMHKFGLNQDGTIAATAPQIK